MHCKISFGDDVITLQNVSYVDIFKTACDVLFVDVTVYERVMDLIRTNKIEEALTYLYHFTDTSEFKIDIDKTYSINKN